MNEFWSRYEQILEATEQLSVSEMEDLVGELNERIHQRRRSTPAKRRSLLGLWKNVPTVTEEDISEARKEMWGNFPREGLL